MKFVIVIPDGAADEPRPELGGLTPLEAARTPNLDRLAGAGIVGRANHTPAGLPAGSDVANLSLFGYDPRRHYTGRAAIEAAAQEIPLGPGDWVIRCNLVTVRNQIMESFTAGQVGSAEARELLAAAQAGLPDAMPVRFFPGVSYRNLAVWRGSDSQPAPFSTDTRTVPPHDLTGSPVGEAFPRGPGSSALCELMDLSAEWFREHPVNLRRIEAGQLPVTNVWLWGLGTQPRLQPFIERHGLRGAMITAVDLLRGLARLIGWDVIEVPGATGYTDTDYAAKGRHAVAALASHDLVTVHIEATDEASHEGDAAAKMSALEAIDREIVGPLASALDACGEPWRMLVTPDHPTLVRTRTHTHGDVPFLVAGKAGPLAGSQLPGPRRLTETAAAASPIAFPAGWQLMDWFLSNRPGSTDG